MGVETGAERDLFARYRKMTAAQQRLLLSRLERQGASLALPSSAALARGRGPCTQAPGFSLFFFADRELRSGPIYELVLACAEKADAAGLEAIWVPERHFHDFGGPYPNPALLASAIAVRTRRIGIRAGSVVVPLHNPIRLVEDWCVVDNLSGGRCGIAVASGWHPADFALLSDTPYESRRQHTFALFDQISRMWRNRQPMRSSHCATDPEHGDLCVHPAAIQPILPMWLTSTSNRETWLEAARRGAGVLTGLLEQTKSQLAENIAAYRAELARYHAPEAAKVTVMLHCLLGPDPEATRAKARAAMTEYFKNHMQMYLPFVRKLNPELDVDAISERDRNALIAKGADRYLAGNALIGSAETVNPICAEMHQAGVDEIACLVDFGPADEEVLETVAQLRILVDRFSASAARVSSVSS